MPRQNSVIIFLLSLSTLIQTGCGDMQDKTVANSAKQPNSSSAAKDSSIQPEGNPSSSPEAIFEIGFEYASKNDKKAIEIANTLINAKGDNNDRVVSQGHYLKGIYFMNISQPELAMNEFDSSIIASYTFVDAYIEKAILLFDKKQYDASLKTLTKAAAIDRYQADIYFGWRRIMKDWDTKKMQFIITNKLLNLHPIIKKPKKNYQN